MTNFRLGIKISLTGTLIEAVGILFDVLHHLNIGLETPEGLITGNHLMIFAGFFINFVGVMITFVSSKNK